jgi:DNA transformation protein
MAFWRAPERLYDEQHELLEWAQLAISVAAKSKAAMARPKSKVKVKAMAKPVAPKGKPLKR